MQDIGARFARGCVNPDLVPRSPSRKVWPFRVRGNDWCYNGSRRKLMQAIPAQPDCIHGAYQHAQGSVVIYGRWRRCGCIRERCSAMDHTGAGERHCKRYAPLYYTTGAEFSKITISIFSRVGVGAFGGSCCSVICIQKIQVAFAQAYLIKCTHPAQIEHTKRCATLHRHRCLSG